MMTQNNSGNPGAAPVVVAAASAPKTITVASQDGEVLRDPQIDEYLLAHQRFSPSVYSTAQYARSASFDVDSGNN
jgi:sigma-E factor negative regulatory protein RseA